jgi:hypothetical protein
LAATLLDVLDAGVAAVGGVDELDVRLDLVVAGEEGAEVGLRGARAAADQRLGPGGGRYGERRKRRERDEDGGANLHGIALLVSRRA